MATRVDMICCVFDPFLHPFLAWLLLLIHILPPVIHRPHPNWLLCCVCCCCCCCCCEPLLALAFLPEAIHWIGTSSVHLWTTSAVILIKTVAESPPMTPSLVAEAFVMVLVGFGGDWIAIRRLPAMVGGWRWWWVVVTGTGRLPLFALECLSARVTRSYFSFFPTMFLCTKVTESYVGEGKMGNSGKFRSNITLFFWTQLIAIPKKNCCLLLTYISQY